MERSHEQRSSCRRWGTGKVTEHRRREGKTNGSEETPELELEVVHLLMIVLAEGGEKHSDLVAAVTCGDAGGGCP